MTVQLAQKRREPPEPGFERFFCRERGHGPDGRLIVEVDWEHRIVKKKCDDCKKMHRFISQER